MDGGYKATLHSFIPYEAQKDQGSPEYAAMSPLERVMNRMNRCWNHVFGIRRSRIERTFGELDRHRFIHYTLRSPWMVALLFRLIWNAEIMKILKGEEARTQQGRPPYECYETELYPGTQLRREFGPVCTCRWTGAWYAGHPKRMQVLQYRDILRNAYWLSSGGRVRASRLSAHSSRADRQDRLDNVPIYLRGHAYNQFYQY